MEGKQEEIEPRFLGPKFTPGDKVRLTDIEYHGYGYNKDRRFQKWGVDPGGTFTVKSVEMVHRSGTGEHDDIGDYGYQVVELEEIPFKAASGRFEPIGESRKKPR